MIGFRAMAEAYLARPVFRPARTTRVEPVRSRYDGGRVRGEWVERGRRTRESTVVLYVHGGAFVAFSPRTHRGMVSEVAARAGLRGAETVIVGIQPEVAFAMVQLGMSFEDVQTALDLEEGLALLQTRKEPGDGGP